MPDADYTPSPTNDEVRLANPREYVRRVDHPEVDHPPADAPAPVEWSKLAAAAKTKDLEDINIDADAKAKVDLDNKVKADALIQKTSEPEKSPGAGSYKTRDVKPKKDQ